LVCEGGFLQIAQWLPTINIHVNDNITFRDACTRGHLEVAQWLYSLSSNVIPTKIDSLFANVCNCLLIVVFFIIWKWDMTFIV
jgi:hypothetical protein